jgi:hypothetical protein
MQQRTSMRLLFIGFKPSCGLQACDYEAPRQPLLTRREHAVCSRCSHTVELDKHDHRCSSTHGRSECFAAKPDPALAYWSCTAALANCYSNYSMTGTYERLQWCSAGAQSRQALGASVPRRAITAPKPSKRATKKAVHARCCRPLLRCPIRCHLARWFIVTTQTVVFCASFSMQST